MLSPRILFSASYRQFQIYLDFQKDFPYYFHKPEKFVLPVSRKYENHLNLFSSKLHINWRLEID